MGVFRFCIADQKFRFSGVWRLKTTKRRDDVLLAVRQLGKFTYLTVHGPRPAEGLPDWVAHFRRQTNVTKGHAGKVTVMRRECWRVGEHLIGAAVVIFPRNLLRKIEPRTSVPHNVTCLPPPDSGQELVVVLWIAEKSLDTGTGWPGCKVGAALLFRTDLPSGCSLFVTGEYRPRTEVKLPIPKEHQRNFGIAIRDNPLSTLVIHGETDRGVI